MASFFLAFYFFYSKISFNIVPTKTIIMNNKQNLERLQALLQMIENCNVLLLDYSNKTNSKWYSERYYTVSRIQDRLKNYYNTTLDNLTKFN